MTLNQNLQQMLDEGHSVTPGCQVILDDGLTIKSKGTTGTQKTIVRTPENLAASNAVAVECQGITKDSKVLTICKMDHAAGLLAQTLPAYSVGAEFTIKDFNAYEFNRDILSYTHTHLTVNHAKAISLTKDFKDLDLTGIFVCIGTDRITWDVIEAFVNQGATVMVNWGMSEVGPMAINIVFNNMDEVNAVKHDTLTLMGNKFWLDWKIEDNMLHVKGDICAYNGWFNTQDIVELHNDVMYYVGRSPDNDTGETRCTNMYVDYQLKHENASFNP